jgi:hypothetical protein
MPRLITSKRILRGSVSNAKRVYDKRTAKSQEAMVRVYFPEATIAGLPNRKPVTVNHALGKTPVQADVVSIERDPAAGPPGQVYKVYPWATSTRATFFCTTANTWADIVLR